MIKGAGILFSSLYAVYHNSLVSIPYLYREVWSVVAFYQHLNCKETCVLLIINSTYWATKEDF